MTQLIAKSMHQIFEEGGPYLTPLLKQIEKIRFINYLLQSELEPGIREHCRAVNWKKSRLYLAVDNSAWKNHLIYQLPALLTFLRQQAGLQGLVAIEVTILLAEQSADLSCLNRAKLKKSSFSAPLPPELLEKIAQEAENIQDLNLQLALERLINSNKQP